MAEVAVKNWDNKTVRTIEVDPVLADYPLKNHLIYEAVLAYQAAGRAGTHKTKNRKDVSGGTRKMWRQKGTGRARSGDNRSPLWRHGGVVHGPQPRDYSWSMPRKMRRNALRSALAENLRQGKIICLESLELASHQTGALEKAVTGLGLEGKTLLVARDAERNLELATRNNPRLTSARALGVSIVDLLNHDHIVISESAFQTMAEVLAR
ncbi:MAG: 50S ribosomal protein L4 [Acidobacteriota bacterium]|nr:50S ribosomal protein L4 [Acidobacteriota bacterium]MDH3786059.1 50S ribosomal protein L4 [Acidobacteriota bacterium]